MSPEQKERAHAANKKWKAKNAARVKEYKHKHYMDNRDKYLTIERDRAYRKRYGITLADYDRMAAKQNGRCAICRGDTPGHERFEFFSVDHCHDSGIVRGLLCVRCNSNLGWFEEYQADVLNYLLASAKPVAV